MNGTEIWSIDGIVDVLCDFEHRDTCNFTWIQEIEIAIFRRGERSSSSRNFYNPDSRVSRITRYTRKWLPSISNFSFEISKDRRWTPQFSIFSTIKKFFQETREETNLFPFHCSFFSGKEKKKKNLLQKQSEIVTRFRDVTRTASVNQTRKRTQSWLPRFS